MSTLDQKVAKVPIFQRAKIHTLEELQLRLADFYIGDHQDRFWGNEKMHWAEQQYKRHGQFTAPLVHAVKLLFWEGQACYRVGDLEDYLKFMRTRSHSDMVSGPKQTFATHVHRIHTWLWPHERLAMDVFRRANTRHTRMAQRVSDTIGSLQAFHDVLTGEREVPVIRENSLIWQADFNHVTVRAMRNLILQKEVLRAQRRESERQPLITATLDSTPATEEGGPAPYVATLVRAPAKEGTPKGTKRPRALTMACEPAAAAAVVASEPLPVGVPVARPAQPKAPKKPKKQKAVQGRDPTLFAPPSNVQQLGRYAGICTPLIKYLKTHKLFDDAGSAHWKGIREWCKTPEGVALLREAGIDPASFHLDHIQDKHKTPLHHAYNCCFMPGGANSHFGDRVDDEKKAYVGDVAWDMSREAINWLVTESRVNWSKFKRVCIM
jgi:hypothetical protein